MKNLNLAMGIAINCLKQYLVLVHLLLTERKFLGLILLTEGVNILGSGKFGLTRQIKFQVSFHAFQYCLII